MKMIRVTNHDTSQYDIPVSIIINKLKTVCKECDDINEDNYDEDLLLSWIDEYLDFDEVKQYALLVTQSKLHDPSWGFKNGRKEFIDYDDSMIANYCENVKYWD